MALGQEYQPLNAAMQAASGMAQQGLASVGARGMRRQVAADTLASQLAVADFNGRAKASADAQEESDAEDALAGREAAILDWSNNVLQSYDPNSPEWNQAKRTIDMISNRSRRGGAHDAQYLDYLEEYGINDPISQGTLGSLAVQYEGGPPTPARDKKPAPKKRSGADSEYDDDVENN